MVPDVKSPLSTLDDSRVDDALDPALAHEGLSVSEKMAQRLASIKPKPLPQKPRILTLIKKIPLLSGFLRSIDHAGNALSGLAKLDGNTSGSLQTASTGFQFAGLALNIIDFLRIPAIYLAFAIAGEKPPMTLSKNARWLYSGVLLGLAIAALAVPFAAPPIAIVMAGLALAFSLVTMGKTLYRRHQLRKNLNAVDNEIASETTALNALRQEAMNLEKQLHAAKTEAEQDELSAQLAALTTDFDERLAQLQTKHDQKFQYEEKLKKKDTAAVVDKGVAVALASVAVIGLALSLFFPPIGLAIFAASAIAGGAYVIGRTAFPFIKGLMNKFSKKSVPEASETLANHPDETPRNEEREALLDNPDMSLTTDAQLRPPVFGSTATTIELLPETAEFQARQEPVDEPVLAPKIVILPDVVPTPVDETKHDEPEPNRVASTSSYGEH